MNRRAGGRHKGRATCVFSSQCRLTWPRSGAGLFCRPACSSTPTKLRQCVSVSASHIQPGWRHCYQTEAGRDLVPRWHVEAARRVADCARVASSYLARLRRFPDVAPSDETTRRRVDPAPRRCPGRPETPVCKKPGPQVNGPGQLTKGAVTQAHENPRCVIITSKAFQIVSFPADRGRLSDRAAAVSL
jgi:hypothetical protein